jgi:hypothetical protein
MITLYAIVFYMLLYIRNNEIKLIHFDLNSHLFLFLGTPELSLRPSG